jgi:hypothetical protein
VALVARSGHGSGEAVFNSIFINEGPTDNKDLPTTKINVIGSQKSEYQPFIKVVAQGVQGILLHEIGASLS